MYFFPFETAGNHILNCRALLFVERVVSLHLLNCGPGEWSRILFGKAPAWKNVVGFMVLRNYW